MLFTHCREESETIISAEVRIPGGSSLDAGRHADGHVRTSFRAHVPRVSFPLSLRCFFHFFRNSARVSF